MGDLIEFYGTECSHCKLMIPLIEKLEKEKKVKVERKEVWHNEKNKKEMISLTKGECMAVPAFVNKKTGEFICGNTTYEKLVKWATK